MGVLMGLEFDFQRHRPDLPSPCKLCLGKPFTGRPSFLLKEVCEQLFQCVHRLVFLLTIKAELMLTKGGPSKVHHLPVLSMEPWDT